VVGRVGAIGVTSAMAALAVLGPGAAPAAAAPTRTPARAPSQLLPDPILPGVEIPPIGVLPQIGPLPPIGTPGVTVPPLTLPQLPLPLPELPPLDETLGGVGGTTEDLVDALPLPDLVPAPGSAPAPAPAPAPVPGSAPAPAPPGSAPGSGPGDATADAPGAGDSAGGDPASPQGAGGEGDSGSESLPERLAAAAGSRTNLMLLALGLGVALLGASPRVRTYRRARREVLTRLDDAYEQERQAAKSLAEADRLKGDFLGMVSHELRTPLTAVKGFVDTVLLHWDRFPEERRRDLLERASGNADDLSRLVDQLVDFARIDANQVDVDPRPLVVRSAVEEVVADLAPVLEEHPVEVDAPESVVMLADTDAFTHVLVNLLTNAAKFSPAGSPITVAGRAERGMVVVSVVDRGVGIAPEDQEQIFERFYQSDGNGNGSRLGTGIGLAIARRFTEVQGGRIWVESEPGNGSTFSFTLPAAPKAAPRELVGTAGVAPA
jgi:signal transduction histidine kinase